MTKVLSRAVRGFLLFLLILTPILLLAGAGVFWFVLDAPAGIPDGSPEEITVGKGSNISILSEQLEDKGLVKDSRYISLRFRILSRLDRIPQLQAGRYILHAGMKPSEILESLTSPLGAQRVYTAITIPPGSTSSQIALKVEQSGLARSEDVLDAIIRMADQYPIRKNPQGLQGYLFPDTYNVETPVESGIDNPETSRETAAAVIRMMADSFFIVLDDIDPSWKELTRMQLHEKVTLASIVEREYRRPEEAPKIAAVFNNRIREGWKLQSCATVVYVIEETEEGKPFEDEYFRFNRRIFERYLEIESDYNTYHVKGLPPGPISSPGRVALEAAFYPADIDALFFVVKDPAAGTHTFAREYKDHLAAREAYLNQYVIKD